MNNRQAKPRRLVQTLLRSVGIQASRISPYTNDSTALAAMLRKAGVDLLLDVGANVGQYAEERIASGYTGQIVSFEPLQAAHQQLVSNAARYSNWKVALRCALGDHTDSVTIKLAEDSRASSILSATNLHLERSPQATTIATEVVPLRRLDEVAKESVERSNRPFLKIDVQGFEEQVLRGATGIMPKLVGLQIELSFVRIYEEQTPFPEMLTMIAANGFSLHRMIPAWINADTGQWLQADGVFFRV